uniref:LETM1 domain containing 1 n=2 Tax=Latimeria chalumnae TaxID=7897 RepID=H3AUE4_LATCH
CPYSTKTKQKSLSSLIKSKAKSISERYERFLERRFPRVYVLHSTLFTGFRLLISDAKEVKRIREKMAAQKLKFEQLPYREMESLRQFRRDIIKAAPLLLISIPPFANYLVFVLMYFFPRQLLIRHFWNPGQQEEYLGIYHLRRAHLYPEIVTHLLNSVPKTANPMQRRMQRLCTKVKQGFHPEAAELHAVRSLFTEPPLRIKRLNKQRVKALSQVMMLTPHLPSFFLRRRLWSHVSELHHLDQALSRLGVSQLSEGELKTACYIRGLNSTHLSTAACRNWLTQWLQLSTRLKGSEFSLLLHSMVLLSTNYHRTGKK